MTDERKNRLRLYLGLVLAAAFVLSVVIWPVKIGNRIHMDLWPPDQSTVGPNLVASAILGTILYFVWKPLLAINKEREEEKLQKLDRNARLTRHLIDQMPGVRTENRFGHSMLTDDFLDDPDPAIQEGMAAPDFPPAPDDPNGGT